MAKQVFLTDLDVALAHLDPVFIGQVNGDPTYASGWQDRGRPPSTGGFEAEGVLCHHTASPVGTTDQTDIRVIIAGNGSAPGPISQLYIGRSAVLYVIAAGRANHGGSGVIPGEASKTDMNARSIGIEVGNNGIGEPWSDPVTDKYAATVAALIDYYGWTLEQVWLHATTGPPAGNHKIDPAGPWQRQPNLTRETWSLDIWRQFVAEHQSTHPVPPEPPIPPLPGDDDMATPVGFITCNAGTRGHHVDGSEYGVNVDGTTFWVAPGGTLQWMHDPGELATKTSVMAGAGMRTDTWNTPVGDPDVFGLLAGDAPGR